MTQTPSHPKAIVVYGALRSGTTLLRLMLNGHPGLSCPGETDFIFDYLQPGGPPWRYDLPALRENRIYTAHEALYPDAPLKDPSPDAFIDRISEDGTKVPVLILHRHLGRALDVYPDLKVVHLVRDPRDVARSSIGMGWAGNVYYGVDHWMGTITDWLSCQDRLGPDQALTITYEDLIAAPETHLARIAQLAGHDYVPAMLDYDTGSTYAKPDPSLTRQWTRKQTADEVGLVEGKIGTLLTRSGYAPSGHPVRHPGPALKTRLWLGNKRAVWAERIRRYGLRDPLIVAVCTRLGLYGLAQGARRRISATQIKYLK